MLNAGPPLEDLTRRLAECPAEFLEEPRIGGHGMIDVAAVVSDLLRDLGGTPLTPDEAATFRPPARQAATERNRLSLTLIAGWLLHDRWFWERGTFAAPARAFLSDALTELAALIPAPHFVTDPDRREELARRCLAGLTLHPAGETPTQAVDRLTTLDSLERRRMIEAAQQAEARAREIREAMAARAAAEAAAKYARE